jgi:hypothetical protein
MMTCCALGEQDAILGHVASRGDRFPRAVNKSLAADHVNWQRRTLCPVPITNSSASAAQPIPDAVRTRLAGR